MANLIKAPIFDQTGKEIAAALAGQEAPEESGSKIKSPMLDETGKAILAAIKSQVKFPAVTGEEVHWMLSVEKDESSSDPNKYIWQMIPLETLFANFASESYIVVPKPDADTDVGKVLTVSEQGNAVWATTG